MGILSPSKDAALRQGFDRLSPAAQGGAPLLAAAPIATTPTPTRTPTPTPSPRLPVLVVPGIMGCWNDAVMWSWKPNQPWGWYLTGAPFPYAKDFPIQYSPYQEVVRLFEAAGYRRDRDLFIACYDWRGSNSDSVAYLRAAINRAKQVSGAAKVNIMAHSMGGLVSRAYLESDAYANDVANLATVGTPNYGAARSYWGWQGGVIPLPRDLGDIPVYLLQLLYTNDLIEKDTVPGQPPPPRRDVIWRYIPSSGQLMRGNATGIGGEPNPFYYVVGAANEQPRLYRDMTAAGKNAWLDALNLPEKLALLAARARVLTIAGWPPGAATTPHQYGATSPSQSWPDGEPTYTGYGYGDNTVAFSSALILYQGIQVYIVNLPDADHTGVMLLALPRVLQHFGVPANIADAVAESMARLRAGEKEMAEALQRLCGGAITTCRTPNGDPAPASAPRPPDGGPPR